MILKQVMTFTEAAKEWGFDTSTLRKLVKTDKVTKDIDYKKSGSVWIITREAMTRVYGEPRKNKE